MISLFRKILNYTKSMIIRLPPLNKLSQECYELYQTVDSLKKELGHQFVPPGHFYSPIPAIAEIELLENDLFRNIPIFIPGINLNEDKQWFFYNIFLLYYHDIPFQDHKIDNLRYFYENKSYPHSDAMCLFCMIRHAKPNKIIEVGSGYSSCAILDTNDLFFNGAIHTTFIEPYPDLFLSLINDSDKQKINLIPKKLQDVPLDVFRSMEKNDMLIIDSSHVSKIGSDVNYIVFDILPNLKSGVFIHFHDVFYPFEYPKEWIYEGRAWNEQYLLRAFLQYNNQFEIVFFNSYLAAFHRDRLQREMPLCLKLGGSIWIQKL